MSVTERLPAFARAAIAALSRLEAAPNRPPQARRAAHTAGGRADQAYAVFRAMFTPDQCRELLSLPSFAGAPHDGLTIPEGLLAGLAEGSIDAINAYSALDLSNYMVSTLLRDSDVMSMAHALEVRVPLLDHVLVEKALRIDGR